jgi:flagellar biosynthesis GTPase FlhF
MCLGTETLAIVTAIGSFASTAVSSIASYQQQQQQTDYANAVAQQQYQAQLTAYKQSERAYAEQIRLNTEAANRGYISEQRKLQAEYAQAAQKAQERTIQSLQQQGLVMASGRTGQSIGLLLADAERTADRDMAVLGQNLAYANQDYWVGADSIFNQQESANNMAASQRTLQPTAPIAMPGPSGIGLVAGLGSAAIGGVSTWNSLKPQKATVPDPTPKPPR